MKLGVLKTMFDSAWRGLDQHGMGMSLSAPFTMIDDIQELSNTQNFE